MKYHNLDLEAYDYRVEGGVERFRVCVTDSPVGQQWHGDAEQVDVPPDLWQRLASLEEGMAGRAELIALGQDLAALLFPPGAREFLTRSRERVPEGEALRIRLRMHTYALADLPWEYVHISPPGTPAGQEGIDGFLTLDRRMSLVRYEVMAQAPSSLDPLGDGPLRLVVLMASPDPTQSQYTELDWVEEQRRIEGALQGVPQIRAEFYPEGTLDALQRALARGAHVFHFYGHGIFQGQKDAAVSGSGGQGYLILVDENRHIWPLSGERLAQSLSGRGVRLAVLSACKGARRDPVNAWTGVAPALIRAGIPAVVGMQYEVDAADAAVFGQSVYRALAAGQAIDAAVTDGRLAILNRSRHDEHGWGIPVLYLRADEGVLFPRPTKGHSARLGAGVGDRQVQRDVAAGRRHVQVDKRVLRTVLVQHFGLEELEALCADVEGALADDGISLQVNMEMVGGGGKMGQVLNLIGYLDRRGYLGYLVEAMRQMRPDIEW
jgi:hypothetical protein